MHFPSLLDPSSFDGLTIPASLDEVYDIPRNGAADGDGLKKGLPSKSNVFQGTTAAGARALSLQLVAFYFRAPVKAFFRQRFDYMIIPREMFMAARVAEVGKMGLFARSTPMIMYYIIREKGMKFVLTNVFPPLFMNATLGAVLYTSYLQTLAALDPTRHSTTPPQVRDAFIAGFAAGGIQSLMAAPLDALSTRMNVHEMLTGKHPTFYAYSMLKLSELGPAGIFAGYSFSLVKETISYGLFFSIFEGVKGQAYRAYVRRYYGLEEGDPKPHYMVGPTFLLLAGVSASFAQQLVQHPIGKIQEVHLARLESIDWRVDHEERMRQLQRIGLFKRYSHSYEETYKQCKRQAKKVGGLRRWLFKGFLWGTVKQVPSTAAGLIVFEIMRRRWAEEDERQQ